MQSASLGFDDPTQNTGGQTPAVQHFIVGGTGSDQLNLMLGSTAAGPTPTTLIGGTAADTGTDVAKVDLSSIIANVSGALTVSVESAALWHIRDSSATPKTLVDVRVNTVTSGTSYDLVFHKPNSTDTVTDTLINVESLKFYNGNTFLSGWNLADHSTLVV
jgi:hypothetical protein